MYVAKIVGQEDIEAHLGWMYYAENLNDHVCQTFFPNIMHGARIIQYTLTSVWVTNSTNLLTSFKWF